jgi:hypothetical protein
MELLVSSFILFFHLIPLAISQARLAILVLASHLMKVESVVNLILIKMVVAVDLQGQIMKEEEVNYQGQIMMEVVVSFQG